MSELRHNGEAALRRALQAAAEPVEPGGDGLNRIQTRVRHRRPMPLPLAWADVALTRLSLRVPDGFWYGWDRAARELRVVSDRFLPSPARARSGRTDRFRLGWLRPVAAMSTAVFIVAAVVYMAIEVPQVISPEVPISSTLHSTGPHQRPGRAGPGQANSKTGSRTATSPISSSNGRNSKPTCPAKPSSRPTITESPSPSPSSTSPTQTSGPSPSPTPSQTSNPSPSPSGSVGTAPAGTANGPSAGSVTDPGASSGVAATKHAALASTTHHVSNVRASRNAGAIRLASAPCPTPTKTKKSSVLVSPDAAGPLSLSAGGDVLAPAEVKGRVS